MARNLGSSGNLLHVALTNTEYEHLALEGRINLSDGHARHDLVPAEIEVIEDFPSIWRKTSRINQEDIELAFSEEFFGLAGQGSQQSDNQNRYFSYSASCSILIAAQIASAMNKKVYLLEPTFDNIFHILRSQRIEVVPVQEAELSRDWLKSNFSPGSVLWLTLPNNPTGFSLDRNQFRNIVSTISELDGAVTLDLAYRFFCPDLYSWDQYGELERSGVRYLCLEDTGKTWATADFKFGLLTCSDSLSTLAHQFHDELLLNVSPVALEFVRRFIGVTARNGGSSFVHERVAEPRRIVHDAMREAGFVHKTNSCSNVPMELMGMPHGSSVDFWKDLRRVGVEVLPAHNYYWSARYPPSDQFRIPLTRPVAELREAMDLVRRQAATR